MKAPIPKRQAPKTKDDPYNVTGPVHQFTLEHKGRLIPVTIARDIPRVEQHHVDAIAAHINYVESGATHSRARGARW